MQRSVSKANFQSRDMANHLYPQVKYGFVGMRYFIWTNLRCAGAPAYGEKTGRKIYHILLDENKWIVIRTWWRIGLNFSVFYVK